MERRANMSSLLAEIFKVREGIKHKAGGPLHEGDLVVMGLSFVCREALWRCAYTAVQRTMPPQNNKKITFVVL